QKHLVDARELDGLAGGTVATDGDVARDDLPTGQVVGSAGGGGVTQVDVRLLCAGGDAGHVYSFTRSYVLRLLYQVLPSGDALQGVDHATHESELLVALLDELRELRSEERRVGKEDRNRWWWG